MTTHFAASLSAITVVGSGIAGGATGRSVTRLLAETSGIPEWMTMLGGPLGAVVAMGIGLKWLSGRLEKAELKLDAKDKQGEETIKLLTEALTRNSVVIEQVTASKDKSDAIASAALRVTGRVGNSLEVLADELRKRPCGINLTKPQEVADKDPTE